MSVSLSSEKVRRMQALADDRGVIAIVSADQRTSVRNALALQRGPGSDYVEDESLREAQGVGGEGPDAARQRPADRPGVGPRGGGTNVRRARA
ncbi:MAG: hypothetical protein R2748_21395 [Bryobacterales bacterium]